MATPDPGLVRAVRGMHGRARRPINLADFAAGSAPLELAPLGLRPPPGPQYVLRMPVRHAGEHLDVPPELAWVAPLLEHVPVHQHLLGVDRPYWYLTVRSGPVASVADDEWHVDGFSMRAPCPPDQNYIWCDRAPTEYAVAPAEFPADFDPLRHDVNEFLARGVRADAVRSCPAGVLCCLDSYAIHRRPPATAGTTRAFVRVSCVAIEIRDRNNAANPRHPGLVPPSDRDGLAFRNSLVPYPAPRIDPCPTTTCPAASCSAAAT